MTVLSTLKAASVAATTSERMRFRMWYSLPRPLRWEVRPLRPTVARARSADNAP